MHSSARVDPAHQFDSLEQQKEAASLGMWVFLVTEIMFFGGINTIVLIISSLTMALAVRNAQLGRRRGQIAMLLATLFFGSVFLGIKMYEYHAHYEEGLFPGAAWHWNKVPELAPKVQLFMTFYWGMTGLHALHMVIGAGLLIWMIWRAWRGHFGPEYYSPVEVMGLYWHFVDIVWIFLFPFLYLIHGVHHHA